MAKLFNRQRNRWRVNQRRHFFNMVDDESVKEDLVSVLQSTQINMSLEIIVLFLEGLVSTDGLLIKGFYVWRQKPLQAKFCAFLLGKCRALIQGRSVEEICRKMGVSEPTFYLYGRLPRCKSILI